MVKRSLVTALSVMLLISAANAISYSMTSSYGGFSGNTRASLMDSVAEWTMVSQENLDHRISGSGDHQEHHWVTNEKGEAVGVGVNIEASNHYHYSWSLIPGQNEDLAARENLDVDQAKNIYAYAQANNTRGYNTKVEIQVNYGSLRVRQQGLDLERRA